MKVHIIVLIFLVYIHVGSSGEILYSGITEDEKQVILDVHNSFRKLVATGSLENQPRGINLLRMKYDDTIAEEAQAISNTTIFAHVIVEDSRWSVGQNIYMSMSTAAGSQSPNWKAAVTAWFNEYSTYNYTKCCTSGTGHYTQIVWAKTQYVGCGYTYFLESDSKYAYQKLYVCNYGPAGNIVGAYPYTTGESGCEDLC